MPTSISLTLDASSVKGPLVTTLCDSLDRLLAAAPAGDSARSLETAVWSMLLDVGRGALEWQCRLAGQQPFRKAQEMLAYFTHDAAKIEDTTIERHAVRVGHLIEQQWLYRKRADIVTILRERATIDAATKRPLLYWSCDAHALRRYVNESWTAEWKMMNGMRLWCVDRHTGATIHIGGELTCGDAAYVRHRLEALLARGIVPADGDFGDGVVATYAFVSDGMPWFKEHLLPQLSAPVAILDIYHLIERWTTYLGKDGKSSKARGGDSPAFRDLFVILFGRVPKRREVQSARQGHQKRRGPRPPARPARTPKPRPHAGQLLLDYLERIAPAQRRAGYAELVVYVKDNLFRMDYRNYRARGLQIGSGAMESIHRTASQERLKRARARWLPETLEAMFRLRMLEIVGRWSEWWQQPDLPDQLARGFVHTAYRTRTGPEAPRRPKPATPPRDRVKPTAHQ